MRTIALTKKEAAWIRSMAQNQLVQEEGDEGATRTSVFNKTNDLFSKEQKVRYTNILIWDPEEDIDDIPF